MPIFTSPRKKWLVCLFFLLSQSFYVTKAEPSKDKFLNWPSWAFCLYNYPSYKDYKSPVDIKKNGCKWGTWVTFAQKIEAIQAKVGDWTNPDNLWLSKDFIAMYKHPKYYYDAIMSYIASPFYGLDKKTIALYVAQPSIKQAWQLYKEKKIDIDLLSIILGIIFGSRTMLDGSPSDILYWNDEKPILEQMLGDLPKHTSLRKALEQVLHNVFPKMWGKYLNVMSRYSYYARGSSRLPFRHIISDALRNKKQFEKWIDGSLPEHRKDLLGSEYSPYFLMILDHPRYYYPTDNPFPNPSDYEFGHMNGIDMLQDLDISAEEKSLAIFGMSQFGVYDPCESKDYYSVLIEYACNWYEQGALSVKQLYRLFVCDFPTFYKYPFFILDYKDENVQRALDKLICLPTIPCGLKEVAQKVKEGRLATQEEMAYMEGYRTFRKTYFTLYESVPSSK